MPYSITPQQEAIFPFLRGVRPLDAKGRVRALCPFHIEADPSFDLYPSGAGRCYGACDRYWRPEELAKKLGIEFSASPTGTFAAAYDYRDQDGRLLFQVVRRRGPPKKFVQRRPDPASPGEWVYNLRGVEQVPYRLPELITAPLDQWVFLVEGERDADRLAGLGLVATTNPGGAGKWRGTYNQHFQGRKVAVLPDNDVPGASHAQAVAISLHDMAATVRMVELPDLPPKGDVSDWLDAGGTCLHHLEEPPVGPSFTPPQDNGHRPPEELSRTMELYEGNRWRPVSSRIIREGFLTHGRFLTTDEQAYFFDDPTKLLCSIEGVDGFGMAILLSERYKVNQTESLYNYLVKDMLVEAAVRGDRVTVHQFAYYDPKRNLLFLDMGGGRILRLDGREVVEQSNGTDGVLFTQGAQYKPWTYVPNPPPDCVASILIQPLNFVESQHTPYDPDEQRVLMLLWLLSIPFESIQPTKPLALAMGPTGAGKSNFFRRVGRLLFGPSFQVNALKRDNEDVFWTATTNTPFAAFDNVDQYIPWLEDALAQSATGIGINKRQAVHHQHGHHLRATLFSGPYGQDSEVSPRGRGRAAVDLSYGEAGAVPRRERIAGRNRGPTRQPAVRLRQHVESGGGGHHAALGGSECPTGRLRSGGLPDRGGAWQFG